LESFIEFLGTFDWWLAGISYNLNGLFAGVVYSEGSVLRFLNWLIIGL
jgi:hypothetical protein